MSEIKVRDVISAIKSYLPFSIEFRVMILKLGFDKDRIPYYFHLLNLYFRENDKDKEICLEKYKELALKLRKSRRTIKKLLISANWRPNLVGNTVAILLRAQKDMFWRLENGGWVAPQLVVGIALIYEGLAEIELKRIIENATGESNPKTIISAYSALTFLESEFAKDFEKTELFKILKESEN